MGLGLRSRPSAMTRIPGKSFSPLYPKLLHGPLNFGMKIYFDFQAGLKKCFYFVSHFLEQKIEISKEMICGANEIMFESSLFYCFPTNLLQ